MDPNRAAEFAARESAQQSDPRPAIALSCGQGRRGPDGSFWSGDSGKPPFIPAPPSLGRLSPTTAIVGATEPKPVRGAGRQRGGGGGDRVPSGLGAGRGPARWKETCQRDVCLRSGPAPDDRRSDSRDSRSASPRNRRRATRSHAHRNREPRSHARRNRSHRSAFSWSAFCGRHSA
jgi:hypothetical protein